MIDQTLMLAVFPYAQKFEHPFFFSASYFQENRYTMDRMAFAHKLFVNYDSVGEIKTQPSFRLRLFCNICLPIDHKISNPAEQHNFSMSYLRVKSLFKKIMEN